MNAAPWEHLEKFPPIYVRLLAKKPQSGTGQLAIADADLAILSGIPLARVREISRMANWDGVSYAEMRAFLHACNFDPTNVRHRNRVCNYENICQKRNKPPFHYLMRSPKWESEFLPLVRMLPDILQRPAPTREALLRAS